MTKNQVHAFENKIISVVGINAIADLRVHNGVKNSIFGCTSSDLLKQCNEYRQLPKEERQFEIVKFDADPADDLTYTLQFQKLSV